MAGGSGTRLWPLSRDQRPKQFLNLLNKNQSLFQQTVCRTKNFTLLTCSEPVVICAEHHRFLAAQQLVDVGVSAETIFLEPCGRNTAAAVATAALLSLKEDPILWVLPSDHAIEELSELENTIKKGIQLADQGRLVIFGVTPTYPETGYGYIRTAENISAGFTVSEFLEKPDSAQAARFLADGNCYWNSGMILARASVIAREMQMHSPAIWSGTERALSGRTLDLDFTRPNAEEFNQIPSEPFDTAVLEKSKETVAVILDAGWSDVGSFDSLADHLNNDDGENKFSGNVLNQNSRNNICIAQHKLVALAGVENLVVVETPDAVLVSNREQSQDIKSVVAKLSKNFPSLIHDHKQVHRPWGKFDSLAQGEGFQVKHIVVAPGQKLSLQLHHHRSEHWIVVRGTARVTLEDKEFLLAENESTYIPIGSKHSLENPESDPLELIEIQSGTYLGEDDIVRFEDRYGRVEK